MCGEGQLQPSAGAAVGKMLIAKAPLGAVMATSGRCMASLSGTKPEARASAIARYAGVHRAETSGWATLFANCLGSAGHVLRSLRRSPPCDSPVSQWSLGSSIASQMASVAGR